MHMTWATMADMLSRRQVEVPTGVFPPPPGVVANLENPAIHPAAAATIPTSWTLLALAFVFLFMRVLSRFNVKTISFRVEDWCALLAFLFALARVILLTLDIQDYGLGRHIWEIPGPYFEHLWRLFNIANMVWCWATLLVKLSILFFYLTVFGVRPYFRWATIATMVLCTLYLIVAFFTHVFQCGPNTYAETDGDGGNTETCMDGITQELAIGGFNIGTDFIILILPIYEVWNLQLTMSKRIGITIIFAAGLFTLLASILRQVFAAQTLSVIDQSYVTSTIVLWKNIELCVGLICSNLLTAPLAFRWALSTPLGSKVTAAGQRLLSAFTGGSSHPRASASATAVDYKDGGSSRNRSYGDVAERGAANGGYSARAYAGNGGTELDVLGDGRNGYHGRN